jgi:hypothetical protein
MSRQADEIDLASDGAIIGIEGVNGRLVEADRTIKSRTIANR